MNNTTHSQAGDTTSADAQRSQVRFGAVEVEGVRVFYREAGAPSAPVLLLLHGFPTSSHMFRDLMPRLANDFRVIAPDLPGFGFTQVEMSDFTYTFDNLTRVVNGFTDALQLDSYAIYVFDYGAPVGFRLALAHPERVTALISQNGNAYEEGLSEGWNPIRAYWEEASPANRESLRSFLTPETTRWQYTHGTTDATQIAPESYTLDQALLERNGNTDIQLDLFYDYRNNVALYPKFQAYFCEHQPPLLAVWGKNDPFFLPVGAQAFTRDNPNAQVHLFDTGHFALETHGLEIAQVMREFLAPVVLSDR